MSCWTAAASVQDPYVNLASVGPESAPGLAYQ